MFHPRRKARFSSGSPSKRQFVHGTAGGGAQCGRRQPPAGLYRERQARGQTMIIEANRFLSRDAAGAARPLLLIGILAATAMTVLVASVLLRHNSAATVPEASSGAAAGASTAESTSSAAAGTGAQRGNAEAAQTRASAGPTAASGTTANPIAGTQVPVGDLIKALKDNSLPMSDRKAAIHGPSEARHTRNHRCVERSVDWRPR